MDTMSVDPDRYVFTISMRYVIIVCEMCSIVYPCSFLLCIYVYVVCVSMCMYECIVTYVTV